MITIPVFHTLEEAFLYCRDMDASLRERLDMFSAEARRLRPAMQDAVDRLVVRLTATDVGAAAPQVGDPMPLFVLPDESGHLVGLDTLLEKGPVAITFHRGHWRPYCRINTHALAEAQDEIAAEGGQIAAIMPDQQHFTAGLKAESHAPFPILTDIDMNLAFWVGAEMQELMTGAGWDVSRSQGSNTWLLPIPASFVVGTDGEVKSRFLDPDYRKRVAVEDLIAALKRAH